MHINNHKLRSDLSSILEITMHLILVKSAQLTRWVNGEEDYVTRLVEG